MLSIRQGEGREPRKSRGKKNDYMAPPKLSFLVWRKSICSSLIDTECAESSATATPKRYPQQRQRQGEYSRIDFLRAYFQSLGAFPRSNRIRMREEQRRRRQAAAARTSSNSKVASAPNIAKRLLLVSVPPREARFETKPGVQSMYQYCIYTPYPHVVRYSAYTLPYTCAADDRETNIRQRESRFKYSTVH